MTVQERLYRKAVMQLLAPVYEVLTDRDEAGAYAYSELCKEVSRLLKKEADRASKELEPR